MSDDPELDALTTASRQDLIAHWEAAYRRPPPKGISRRLLEYAAAYNIQVRRYGGLSTATRRKLLRIGRKERERVKPIAAPTTKRQSVGPGSRLVREWHGRTHTVDVLEKGFRFNGTTYKSLSEIARVITGAHWSGPRFFGL